MATSPMITVKQLGRCLAQGFAYQGEVSENLGHRRGESTAGLPPQAFVAFLQNHDQIGNRAQGERLTSLSDPARLALARAGLLLSPQIPMIFMGDEWGATTPFQFFVNFERDPDLEAAIRVGRAKEFEKFSSFKAADGGSAVPDPTALETFKRSMLDWSEPARAPHDAILADTKRLLALRESAIVPLLASGFIDARHERLGAGGLLVEWRFADGTLTFLANFADAPMQHPAPDDATVLWQSEGTETGSTLTLKGWTGVMLRSEAA